MQNNETSTGLTQGIGSHFDPYDVRSTRESVTDDNTTIAREGTSCICHPTSPSRTRRYNFNRPIKDGSPGHKIKPFSISLSENCETPLPQDWQRLVHPDGLPFFFLPPSLDRPMGVVTEEWIDKSDTFESIQNAIQHIQDKISEISHDQTSIWPDGENDLLIELRRRENGQLLLDENETPSCGYYLVNHLKRRIYWAEEVTLNHLSNFLQNVCGRISEHQAEICLEAEYWANWDHFPALQDKKPETYDCVIEAILDVMTDLVSSDHSASRYKYKELQRRLEIVKAAKECKSSNWNIGRFMKEITMERLRNYYGAKCARLSGEQTVVESTGIQEHSLLFTIVSPFLFFIPHTKLHGVSMAIVDQTVIPSQWRKLVDRLLDEWHNTILIATIILTADCALLGIPAFQKAEFKATNSSPEQMTCYLSLTTSLFGLVLGIMMSQRHKARKGQTVHEIDFLNLEKKNKPHTIRRMQFLCLVWSLPQALVMWSVIAFSIGALLVCFLGTLTSTRVIIASSAAFLGCFTLYYGIRFGSCWGLIQRSVSNLTRVFSRRSKMASPA